MLTRVCLGLVLFMATPVWSQLTAIPFETPAASANEARMLTPPPVSAQVYPTTLGSQMHSNYLAAWLVFNTAYSNNVLVGDSVTPVGDFIYTILPTVALNKTTPRQDLTLTYSPGFSFYQHTNSLNAANQNAAFNFQYRLSQHTTINLSDSFQKSSNVFDLLYPISGGPLSGSSQSQPIGVVAPYEDQLHNTATMGVSYQFSRNGLIGATGAITNNNYPNPSAESDLYNSKSIGGSAFYTQRLSSKQYIGVTYQYSSSHSNPVNSALNPVTAETEVQTHTLLTFYSIYLKPTLSLSLAGGPQYTGATQSPSPQFNSWTPSVMTSIGWQGNRTNFVASYSRTVSGSLGLPGAYNSYSVSSSVLWQMTRSWIVGAAGSYLNNRNVTPSFLSSNPGGQTASTTTSVQYFMGEHLSVELGYSRIHQNYSGIAVISAAPNSNRGFVSISYRATRPLGR